MTNGNGRPDTLQETSPRSVVRVSGQDRKGRRGETERGGRETREREREYPKGMLIEYGESKEMNGKVSH